MINFIIINNNIIIYNKYNQLLLSIWPAFLCNLYLFLISERKYYSFHVYIVQTVHNILF